MAYSQYVPRPVSLLLATHQDPRLSSDVEITGTKTREEREELKRHIST